MKRTRPLGLCGAAVALAVALGGGPAIARYKVTMPNEAFKELERFEAHSLQQADDAFQKKDYKQALANYEAFLQEFPRSRAVPYAVLRKARCLHLLEERFAAIDVYQQVLDFFPNHVRYAAPAKYYIGRCHWQNGDVKDAIGVWAELADDKQYSKHHLAAKAINRLAEHLAKNDERERAVEYWKQVAVDFRKSNWRQAWSAIQNVLPYHVRRDPDEPALRSFYEDVQGFGRRPKEMPDNVKKSRAYWSAVRGYVKKYGDFNKLQKEKRNEYYRYWAEQMEGRFSGWDAYQIDRINFIRIYEQDTQAWIERLDEQFAEHQDSGDYERVVRWIDMLAAHDDKVQEYYAKLNFGEMSPKTIRNLFVVLWDDVGDEQLARRTFRKIPAIKLSDDKKANMLYPPLKGRKIEDLTEELCKRFNDKTRGRKLLLEFYHYYEMVKQGVALADKLIDSAPDYAEKALWIKGDLLQLAGKFDPAIEAFRQSNRAPKSLFRIAQCHVGAGRLAPAVQTLQEIQNFFGNREKYGDTAARAALITAHYFQDAGRMDQYKAALRRVLKKYPESRQSSRAHRELEKLGVDNIGGGEKHED